MIHVPRKRFGQHFLVDPSYVARIVAALAPGRDDNIVEIGPGLGALTHPLAERLQHLHVVEIDRDLAAKLEAEYADGRVIVHLADALEFDFGTLPAPLRVVGNLPYNISTPLLFHLARFAANLRDLHFMLQKEVVDRMVASPSTAEYGRLSVMLQYRFAMEKLFDVPPGAFRPPPKVQSAVVRMVPRPAAELDATDEALLGKIVTTAFTKRRKTLRNALADFFDAETITRVGVDPGARPENLAPGDYVRLANAAAATQSLRAAGRPKLSD